MKHTFMKHVAILVFCAALACGFAALAPTAQAQEAQVTRSDLDKVLQRLDELAKKNADLEKKNNDITKTNKELTDRIKVLEQHAAPAPAPAVAGAKPAQNTGDLSARVQNLEKQMQSGGSGSPAELAQIKADVRELSGIMEEVERKTLTDKVKIGAELRTRIDWYNYSTQYKNLYGIRIGEKHPVDEHVSAMPTMRLRLNLSTDILNNLKFHARLTMNKVWNDQDRPGYPYKNMLNEDRVWDDTDLGVERAYVDYFFKIWDTLPMAFTFGRLPFTDGLPTDLRDDTPRKSTYPALAFDGEGDGLALSTDLSHYTGLPDSALRLIWCRNAPDNEYGIWKEDQYHHIDMDFYVAQLETGLPGSLRDTLLIFNMIYFPQVPTPELPGIPVMPVKNPSDLGNLIKFTLFGESKRFLGTRFDLFAGFSYQKSHADTRAKFGIAGIPLVSMGVLNDDGTSDRDAHAFQVGFRYTFPWELLNQPKFGVEYNRNSKYWFGLNAGAEDPLMKLDARGNAIDFYYIQPINENFMFRLGYTYLHREDYGLWMWGQPAKISERIRDMYLLMDARF